MKRILSCFMAIVTALTFAAAAMPVPSAAASAVEPFRMTFSSAYAATYFYGGHNVSATSVEDADYGRALRLSTTGAGADPFISFRFSKYAEASGLGEVSADDYKAVVVRFRQAGCSGRLFELFYFTGRSTGAVAGDSIFTLFDNTDDGWQYVAFDMSQANGWTGKVNGFRFDYMVSADRAGESITLGEIMMFASVKDAVGYYSTHAVDGRELSGAELEKARGLMAEARDPVPEVSEKPVRAEYEDGDISLWFNHSYVKTPEESAEPTGMSSYTVQLAKNEIEGFQFLLSSGSRRDGLTVSLTPFTDASGNTLKHVICYGYYFENVEGYSVPDPIPELKGSFSLKAGKSKMFLIKVYTDHDTDPGMYSATLSVLDPEGKEIKRAPVYAYVWNFDLPDASNCKMTADLSWWNIYSANAPWLYTGDDSETYVKYYEYLLENKINAYNLPYLNTASGSTNPYSDRRITKYLDDPRVQSFNPVGFGPESFTEERVQAAYGFLSQKQEWLDKAYFYPLDEPGDYASLDRLKEQAAVIKKYFGDDVKIITPMHMNEASDGGYTDFFSYVEDTVNVWCPHTYLYNTLEEHRSNPFLYFWYYSAELEEKLGSFESRMAARQAEGDEVWWYVTHYPHVPEITLSIDDTEVEHRLLFWQQKLYGVDGFLYYLVNDWIETTPWDAKHETNSLYPYNTYGNGVLVYNGFEDADGNPYLADSYSHYDEMADKSYNAYPVGSLRLESVRDGAEDYDYFTILDSLYGDGTSDLLIKQITTSLGCWSTDAELLNRLRTAAGNLIAAKYEFKKGDVDGDGRITIDDAVTVLRYAVLGDAYVSLFGELTYTGSLDFCRDGVIDVNDAFTLFIYSMFPKLYPLK